MNSVSILLLSLPVCGLWQESVGGGRHLSFKELRGGGGGECIWVVTHRCLWRTFKAKGVEFRIMINLMESFYIKSMSQFTFDLCSSLAMLMLHIFTSVVEKFSLKESFFWFASSLNFFVLEGVDLRSCLVHVFVIHTSPSLEINHPLSSLNVPSSPLYNLCITQHSPSS